MVYRLWKHGGISVRMLSYEKQNAKKYEHMVVNAFSVSAYAVVACTTNNQRSSFFSFFQDFVKFPNCFYFHLENILFRIKSNHLDSMNSTAVTIGVHISL